VDIAITEKAGVLVDRLTSYLDAEFNNGTPNVWATISGAVFARHHDDYDIMLRICENSSDWPPNSIVIARIGFDKTQQGLGTKFLNWLAEVSLSMGFSNICIETANHNATAFGKKRGFQELLGDLTTKPIELSTVKKAKNLVCNVKDINTHQSVGFK